MTRAGEAPRGGAPALHLASLGCPKNQVDSERMLGLAAALGFALTDDPAAAEVIVVNSCGFIQAAVEESIQVVLELGRHKAGRCRKLILAGCLAQRHAAELAEALPEVDHLVGAGGFAELQAALQDQARRLAVAPPGAATEERWERAPTALAHTAYLKIAEGCDRPCAFCTIPAIRGPQRSRAPGSLVQEARALCARGARELTLVAQDTTAYGRDLDPPADLASLLQALDGVPGLRWLRLLYAYPSSVDARLIEALATLPRVVKYLDLPIQHIDDEVLARMRRGYDGDRVRRTLDALRQAMPGVALRTTLLSGHPGESPQAHRRLVRFLEQAQLDHVGVFPFSAEPGAPAAAQPDPVPGPVAEERAAELMALQGQISSAKLARLRGQELQVLVDGPSPESEFLMQGRHAGQALDVDGVVVLTDGGGPVGELLRVRVTDSAEHDLVATPLLDPG